MPSFDLHVLSTPPAFILSQDQTLMLILFQNKLTFVSEKFYFFIKESIFNSKSLFKVVPLFSCQRSGPTGFSCPSVLFSFACLAVSYDRIAPRERFVNTFFQFFSKKFFEAEKAPRTRCAEGLPHTV